MNALHELFEEMNKIYSPDFKKADGLIEETQNLSHGIDDLLATLKQLRQEAVYRRRIIQEQAEYIKELEAQLGVEDFKNEDYSGE